MAAAAAQAAQAAQGAADQALTLIQNIQAAFDAHKTEAAAHIQQLQGVVGGLEAEVLLHQAQSRSTFIRLEESKAIALYPKHLSEAMDLKLQHHKETFILARTGLAMINLPEPDVIGAKEVLGKIYRLSNNALAAADISKEVGHMQLSFIDLYYDKARSKAMEAPESADWAPESELVKYDNLKKEAIKVHGVRHPKAEPEGGKGWQHKRQYKGQQQFNHEASGSGVTVKKEEKQEGYIPRGPPPPPPSFGRGGRGGGRY